MNRLLRPLLLALTLAIAGTAALWVWHQQRNGPAPANDMARVAVPSGADVYFTDLIEETGLNDEETVRFRFVVPAIAREGGTMTAETAQDDMQALCDGYALAHLPATAPQPQQVIISFSDRWVPFGETAPEATQFFQAYRVENDACIWEMF